MTNSFKLLLSKIEQYISEVYIKEVNAPLGSSKYICCDNMFIDFTKKVEKSFSETLIKMIDERNLQDTEVYKKANIDRRHFSKMRDKHYHPRKNTIIKFIFSLELNIEESEKLLKSAGYVLTTSDLRDVIIMYFIENNEYDLFKINDILSYYKLDLI